MTEQNGRFVVYELIQSRRYYLADFGIANGQTAQYSFLTRVEPDLAIPFTGPDTAVNVASMLANEWPTKEWSFCWLPYEVTA